MIPEDLVKKLKSDDPQTRKDALTELGHDPDPDQLACLIEALSDPEERLRHHARSLLLTLTGRDYLFSREDWTSWWKDNAFRSCLECKTRLYNHPLYYRIKPRSQANPGKSSSTTADLLKDTQAEMKEICLNLHATTQDDAETRSLSSWSN